MEFREVVRRRRMVRRFAQGPVPMETIDRILEVARRAPSAGFAQGIEFLVLDRPDSVRAFWETTRDPAFGWEAETIEHGPTVLILPLPDPRRYLERYAQPDKIAFGMDREANWPVRFWEIDAAMAAMSILLAAGERQPPPGAVHRVGREDRDRVRVACRWAPGEPLRRESFDRAVETGERRLEQVARRRDRRAGGRRPPLRHVISIIFSRTA
jgi:nitroreductase